MDTSYLAQQVNSIVGQLHGLFDEMGVPSHEREAREAELFAALSDTLSSQVRTVANEKQEMINEAQSIITTIRQMEASMDEPGRRREHRDDDDLEITLPLNRCIRDLKEKHSHVGKLHRERFEQVKKLAQALESYSSHLEPGFVQIVLPPTGSNSNPSPTFDLSHSYVDGLDKEFTRVYEEYARRIATVQGLADNIINLWAELGTPQAQTEPTIVKYYRDAPEQLGLHQEDIARLRARVSKLMNEKKSREKKLESLRAAVDALWQKLGIDEAEQTRFLNANRGCGVRQINEFEDELNRLNELKRQNMHLFVEDARYRLQELWDALYFSEDEMLEFSPAFSDVYSDALLEAHERELGRLEVLKEQRAPTLALVDRYRTLVAERDELAASSQDASRLMMKAQKGEKRDPGKLLREEKMRKRIAKELPKVAADLQGMLEQWEEEYGRPFLVHGERYLDVIEDQQAPGRTPGPRSKTPAGPPPSATKGTGTVAASAPASAIRAGALGRANSTTCATTNTVKPQTVARTPTAPTRRVGAPASAAAPSSAALQMAQMTIANPKGSPTRIPGRGPPLANFKYGGSNSPERKRPESAASEAGGSLRGLPASLRAPPPKLRDLTSVPELGIPNNPYAASGLRPGPAIRGVDQDDDDVFDDRSRDIRHVRSKTTVFSSSMRGGYGGGGSGGSQQEFQDDKDRDADPSGHWRSRSTMVSSLHGGAYATYHSNLSTQSHPVQSQYATHHSNLSTQSHPVQGQYGTLHSNHSTQSHPGYHTHHHNVHLPAPEEEEYPRPDTALSASFPRLTSDSSQTSTTMSGSENWETYDDDSEPELDASDTYFAKVRAARGRRGAPSDAEQQQIKSAAAAQDADAQQGSSLKRYRAPPPPPPLPHAGRVVVDAEGNRIISGSEWADEETF